MILFGVVITVGLMVICDAKPVFAMGGPAPSPTEEVEIIEEIITRTEEVESQEEYEMKMLVEIPKGNKPGELGVEIVEGMAILPDRLAVDGQENIYIFDKANNRINKYDKLGRFMRDYQADSFQEFPPEGGDPNPILVQNDIDMGVDDEGNIYVLNGSDVQIRKLDPKGEIIDRLPAPAGANYIKAERDGRVEALKYKDGQISIFDVSSKQIRTVNGFKTPGGVSVVIGEQKLVSDPRSIKIFDKTGELIKEFEIKTSYELYAVDFLGADNEGNLYLLINRQSDETKEKLIDVNPKRYKTIRLLGYYIQKYDATGRNLLATVKFVPSKLGKRMGISWGQRKYFAVDVNGYIYSLIRHGSPFVGEINFKVFKWERKE
jgi:hypothetical protein